MKTIILYATKHGAAGEIAQRIANRMNNTVIHKLGEGDIPSLVDFDCIIIGSSLYVGMIRKEAKTFLLQNANVLQEKKFGLFLCGLDASKDKTCFDTNFSPDILQKAKATGFLGGIFDPQKAGVLERLIMKVVVKKSTYTCTIDNEKIEQFVEAMNA